jgi:acetyl-CoA carboxylase biotin carboxyl carrier protein
MAASKTRASKHAPEPAPGQISGLSLGDIRSLAKVVNQYDLTEIEIESGGERLRIRRDRTNGAVPGVIALGQPESGPVRLAAPEAAAVPVPAPVGESEKPSDGSVLITSPFVGTFYQAPSPESPPFVEVGQTVKKGQVLCIVEAMKLMNEIEAETSCKILEVLAQNAEPVEFGQALFRVFPLA